MPTPRRPASGTGAQELNVRRNAVDIIDVAETVRPRDRHAVIGGDARDLRLQCLPFGTGLGKSRRIDDDPADAALGATGDRIEDAGARDRERRAIDALRQVRC